MRANRLVLAGAVIAGEVLLIPAGAVHAAKNAGKRKGAELATYIVLKGEPLLTEVSDGKPK